MRFFSGVRVLAVRAWGRIFGLGLLGLGLRPSLRL